jgi:hypothetical protein
MKRKAHKTTRWYLDNHNYIVDENENIIAQVEDSRNLSHGNLIAAAPDLLKTLKNAIAHPVSWDWYKEARQAIAKAEGKE